MKSSNITLGLAAVATLAAAGALAHHSRANFDLDKTVQYEGTVTRFSWTNPHTGIDLEVKDANGKPFDLKVEGNSIATMMRRGWTQNTLKVGDHVIIKGNPDRVNSHFLYFTGVERVGGAAIAAGFQQAPDATAGSKDFSGVWRPVFNMGGGGAGGGGPGAGANSRANRAILLGGPKPSNYPVTAKGAASYARFNGKDDPRNNCVPESLPSAISSIPYLFQIEHHPNGDYETVHENYAARRVIHMNQKAPPAGTKPDFQGYSIGHMEGAVLVVDTTLFSPQPWGNDTGLDSGAQKHIVERYSLEDGGKTLVVSYTQTDPEYLAQPVTRSLRWKLVAQDKLQSEWAHCSKEAGNRHIIEEAKRQ